MAAAGQNVGAGKSGFADAAIDKKTFWPAPSTGIGNGFR
jgi:hypothetical protein